jgi:hypothetical protein
MWASDLHWQLLFVTWRRCNRTNRNVFCGCRDFYVIRAASPNAARRRTVQGYNKLRAEAEEDTPSTAKRPRSRVALVVIRQDWTAMADSDSDSRKVPGQPPAETLTQNRRTGKFQLARLFSFYPVPFDFFFLLPVPNTA